MPGCYPQIIAEESQSIAIDHIHRYPNEFPLQLADIFGNAGGKRSIAVLEPGDGIPVQSRTQKIIVPVQIDIGGVNPHSAGNSGDRMLGEGLETVIFPPTEVIPRPASA